MEKRKKWLVVMAAFLLLCSIVAAVIVIQLYLSTEVTLIVPHDIRADITSWGWFGGNLSMGFGDTAVSTQQVTFMSYGAKPLVLSASVDGLSVSPAWLNPHYYSLDWTAEDYEIQPLESLETNFTLTIDVPLVREYMIPRQIMKVDVTFDIIVSADYVLIYHNLTIETTPNGTTDPAPGVYPYRDGIGVTVTGIPDLGYAVDCWNLDGVNYTINPITVTMDADHSVIAYFKEVPTMVFVDPELVNVGVGETFTVAIKVANVENLYGVDVLFGWNASLLEYVSHTAKIPTDSYPDGILYAPGMMIMDAADPTAGTYQVAYACMDPAPSFNGSGIIFEITFNVIDIGSCPLDITASDLSHKVGVPILHEVIDGLFDNTS